PGSGRPRPTPGCYALSDSLLSPLFIRSPIGTQLVSDSLPLLAQRERRSSGDSNSCQVGWAAGRSDGTAADDLFALGRALHARHAVAPGRLPFLRLPNNSEQ